MIIVKIKGGLGNQMFQYACGKSLAEKTRTNLVLDLTWYEAGNIPLIDTPRKYTLDKFNTTAQIASPEEIKTLEPHHNTRLIKKIIEKIKRVLLHKTTELSISCLVKKKTHYLDGFWQSEEYFKDIREIILKEFSLKNPLTPEAREMSEKIAQTKNSVALHVRRGDYVTNKSTNSFHGTCTVEYYQKAVDELTKRIGSISLFMFSDDIEWVRQNLKFPIPTTYVEHADMPDYERMILMSHCEHNIIANSSFSWWGAWLNQNPEKIVIAPERWFNGNEKNNVVPASWIKI